MLLDEIQLDRSNWISSLGNSPNVWSSRSVAEFMAIGTVIASIGGTLAAIAKDRSDRSAIVKELGELKTQVLDLIDAVERVKARLKGQGPDAAVVAIQRQLESFDARIDKLAARIDERDEQRVSLQRELGAIGAKIEILLAAK